MASAGWCDGFGANCSSDPLTAAYTEYLETTFGLGTFQGVTPTGSPSQMQVHWYFFSEQSGLIQYYCPPNSGSPMPPQGCPSGPPPCECDNGGTPAPSTPKPIDVLSGNERLTAEDFANATQSLVLSRVHASAAQAGASAWRASTAIAPITKPLGLGNWLYDFQYELHISGTAATSPVLVMAPNGAAPAFVQNSTQPTSLTLVPYLGSLPPNPQTDFALQLVGSWPANLTAQQTTWTLTDGNDTVYTLKTYLDPNSGVWDIARPVAIQWRDGHSWTLSYGAIGAYDELDKVTDNFGNVASFTWTYGTYSNNPQAISIVSLPGGYSLNYGYQSVGGAQSGVNIPELLTSVQYLDNTSTVQDSTSYQYSNSSCPYNATTVLDSGGTQRWGVTYDPGSCMATVSSVTGAAGADRSYQVGYQAVPAPGSTFTRTVTNPLGTISIFTYRNNGSANQGLQLIEVDENVGMTPVTGLCTNGTPTPGESFRCYQYGSNGFVSQLTDENGNVEQMPSYDPRGMAAETIEAAGQTYARTTNYAWDSAFHEPDSVAAPTVTTSFTYNATGEPLTKTLTDQTGFTTPYTTFGRTRTWNYFYYSSGELQYLHGPRWPGGSSMVDTYAYAYNANGYLQSITNPLGQATAVTSWNWRGQPASLTDSNGVVTSLTYDIHGRLLTSTVNPGSTQSEYQFQYDPVGDLTQVTLPRGATVQYNYDQGQRLTKVTDIRGETRTYTYDKNDDPLSLVTANGSGTTTQTHTAAYDEWGRIIQSIGAASQTWNLAYDNLSNLTTVTDPPVGVNPANVRANTYDGLNRVTVQTDPLSNSVHYAYDASDNLTQLTDPLSLATSREVDGFGEVIQEVSPDRGTLSFWFDADGNLIKKIDGDSIETDQTFDAASRLTQRSYPSDGAETATYTYDQTSGGNFGIGRLTSVTDVSGSEALTYDAQGRRVTDAKAITSSGYATPYTTTWTYDANGKVIGIGYPSGDALTYSRTTDGLVTTISFTPHGGSQQTAAHNVTFEPYGPVTGLVFDAGATIGRTFDQDYRLTRLTTSPTSGSAWLDESFGWQADGRIASVTDNLRPTMGFPSRTSSYAYTPAGRISTASGPWAGAGPWSWDANGNITSLDPYTLLQRQPGSNRIGTMTSNSGYLFRTYTYLPGGELSEDTGASNGNAKGTGVYAYVFNAARRMTQVEQAPSWTVIGSYAYDFAGQRVWSNSGAPTAYTYDSAGHVQTEATANTGAPSREYVWLDDTLVGIVVWSAGSPTFYGATTGQLDEPQLVSSSAPVWNGYIYPNGRVETLATPTISNALGYPGQWSQVVAQMAQSSQNGQRDYEPLLFRYLEPDPLGIDAGPNPYAYVDGDPLNDADQSGLQADLNLFPKGQDIHNWAQRDTLGPPRTYSVAGHSNGNVLLDENGQPLASADLANLIRRDKPHYHPGEVVVLGACRIATSNTGYPQLLANDLQAPVVAPVGYAWYSPFGGKVTSKGEGYFPIVHQYPTEPEPWHIFYPQRK